LPFNLNLHLLPLPLWVLLPQPIPSSLPRTACVDCCVTAHSLELWLLLLLLHLHLLSLLCLYCITGHSLEPA
jgi:hypothetical protein